MGEYRGDAEPHGVSESSPGGSGASSFTGRSTRRGEPLVGGVVENNSALIGVEATVPFVSGSRDTTPRGKRPVPPAGRFFGPLQGIHKVQGRGSEKGRPPTAFFLAVGQLRPAWGPKRRPVRGLNAGRPGEGQQAWQGCPPAFDPIARQPWVKATPAPTVSRAASAVALARV